MKRFFLIKDERFSLEEPIEYHVYRGGVRKNQTNKLLKLTVPHINKKGQVVQRDKGVRVKIRDGVVITG